MKRSLYTLSKYMPSGKGHEVLNGKVFAVKKKQKSDGRYFAQFIDVSTDTPIWNTSTVLNIENTINGIQIVTKNTKYDLIDLQFIVPTTVSISVDEELEEPPVQPLEMIDCKETDVKHIHYGDGYFEWEITMNRSTTESELREWYSKDPDCVWKTKDQVPWWESYRTLEPISDDGTKWRTRVWDRYTD